MILNRIYGYVIGFVVLIGLLVGAFFYVKDIGKQEVEIEYAKLLSQATQKTIDQERLMQSKVDLANSKYQESQIALDSANSRIANISKRMRPKTVINYTQNTAKAVGDYAEGLEADFTECRDEYVKMGAEYAQASEGIKALSDAWPDGEALRKEIEDYKKELMK